MKIVWSCLELSQSVYESSDGYLVALRWSRLVRKRHIFNIGSGGDASGFFFSLGSLGVGVAVHDVCLFNRGSS